MAGAMVCAVLVAVIQQAWYRGVEAAVAGRTAHDLFGCGVSVVRSAQTFFFEFHADRFSYLGLDVSLGCSSLLLIVPVVGVTAVLVVVSRISLLRLTVALAATVAVVVAVNMLRLLAIVYFVNAWGLEAGFGWSHTFLGSLLALAGISSAAFLYCRLVYGAGARS
ncbi:hypothetical protein GCM10010442_33640 [Kitasatospora kifunensis]